MNGTVAPRRDARAQGQSARRLSAPDLVLAALSVSALVSASAAYIALDYVTSPFVAGPGVVAAAPDVDARGPFLAEAARPAVAPVVSRHVDAEPSFTQASLLPDAPSFGTTAPSPVRLIYGPPPVLPELRPRATDRLFALAPAPRPGVDAEEPIRPVARIEPPAGASTFSEPAPAEPGLTASLRPAERPSDFATVVASAREPANATELSTIEVARAAAPEAEVAPARLELGSIGPIRGAENPCHRRLTRDMPGRSRSAPGGSEVIAGLETLGGADRDGRIVEAVLSGNVPDFLRNLRPVSFTGRSASGQDMVVTICVTPDYLAVGSDRDFVRVPLGLPAALQVADRFEMMLPTPRMVDAIFSQADLRLSPQPMEPGAQMTSTNYFLRHDGLVDQQMARAGGRLGLLVAGQKKDVVLANRLSANPGRVAIYGWHRASGSPIQPLSTVHGAQYADYSHGIRLVSRTAFVNGRSVDLRDLLTDARYAGLLNADGVLSGRAMQMAALQ